MQKSFLQLQPKYSKEEYKANSKQYELIDIIPVLEKNDFDYIYRPNDDSYLFIDTLFMELQSLAKIDNAKIAEIGCGSGFLINNLVSQLEKLNPTVQGLAVDINFDACYFTQKVASKYNLPVTVIKSSFLQGSKSDYLDVVICNPPYVITDPEEDVNLKANMQLRNKLFKQMVEEENFDRKKLQAVNCLATSYAGGHDGCDLYPDIILNAHVSFQIV
jgi:release factor glutamine methyltransferase